MIKRIHIFSAQGSGCTSLGTELAKTLGYAYFDKDNYISSDGKVLDPLIRNTLLDREIRSSSAWILSGDICGWGNFLIRYFDLVIFLFVPQNIRMERLKKREEIIWAKRGRKIENNKNYEIFIKWAEGYDTRPVNSTSLAFHEKWLTQLSCPVFRLEGANTLEENVEIILKKYF